VDYESAFSNSYGEGGESFTLQKLHITILFSYKMTHHKSPVPDHHVTTAQTYLIIMSPQHKHT